MIEKYFSSTDLNNQQKENFSNISKYIFDYKNTLIFLPINHFDTKIINEGDKLNLENYVLLNIVVNDMNQNDNGLKLNDTIRRRKYAQDSIHKKIKRFYLKYVRNKCIQALKIKIPKINQNVITNVSIKYNKNLLKCSIKEFFKEYCYFDIIIPYNDCSQTQSKVESFLSTRLSDLYISEYLNESFIHDLRIVEKKENELYCKKFKEISKNFINYFMTFLPYQKKFKNFDNGTK